MLTSIIIVAVAGVTGGIVAALIPGGRRQKRELVRLGAPYQPGLVASAVVGGFAAVAAWGLGEDVSDLYVLGPNSDSAADLRVTVGELVAAMATGLAGFKWLSNHWDSKLNNFIAQKAAAAPANADAQQALINNDPKRALEAVRQGAR